MEPSLLKIGNKAISSDEALSLLSRYQLLPQLIRNIITDQAIADISYSPEEELAAIAKFESQQQITSPEARTVWLAKQGLCLEEMQEIGIRTGKIKKFKSMTWAAKVDSYFLARKTNLDQVVYSLIRVSNQGLAQEIYFRIQEGEQSFAELAREYSEGSEANTGGLVGPVPMSQPHSTIGKILAVSQPGQLWTPRSIADWFVIIRLEKLLPAKLDDDMRQRLLDELFETWLQEQMKKVELIRPLDCCAA